MAWGKNNQQQQVIHWTENGYDTDCSSAATSKRELKVGGFDLFYDELFSDKVITKEKLCGLCMTTFKVRVREIYENHDPVINDEYKRRGARRSGDTGAEGDS